MRVQDRSQDNLNNLSFNQSKQTSDPINQNAPGNFSSLQNTVSTMRQSPEPVEPDISKPSPSIGLRADAATLFAQADALDSRATELRVQFTNDANKEYKVNGKITIYPGKEGLVDPSLLARARQQEEEEKRMNENNPAKQAIARAEALEAEARDLRASAQGKLDEAAELDKNENDKNKDKPEPSLQRNILFT